MERKSDRKWDWDLVVAFAEVFAVIVVLAFAMHAVNNGKLEAMSRLFQ